MARRKARIDTVLPLLPGLREFLEAEARQRSLLSRALSQARRVKDGVKRAVRARRRREKRGLAWEESPFVTVHLARLEKWEKEKDVRWEILWEAVRKRTWQFMREHPLNVGKEDIEAELLDRLLMELENKKRTQNWDWRFVPLTFLKAKAQEIVFYQSKEYKPITNLTFKPYFRAVNPVTKKREGTNADLIRFSSLTTNQDGEFRELWLPDQNAFGISPENLISVLDIWEKTGGSRRKLKKLGDLGLAWA